MILFRSCGAVAIAQKNAAYRRGCSRYLSIVARKPHGNVGQRPCADTMMVAAGQQRSTGWRTHRCCMEIIVPRTLLGQAVEIGRRDWPAKGAGCAEANIVSHDQQDVRRVLRRLYQLRPDGSGLIQSRFHHASEGLRISEEHTSDLQSLMRTSYTVFCLKK